MFKKVLSLLALEVFLIIGFNYEDVKCFAATDFSDVPISHMYYEDITYMRENGYVSGYGDNTFKPDRDVTLLETAVMLKNIDGEKASQPLPYCFSEGLIPLEIVSKDPYTKLNRAEIYNILFDYFQVNVYHLDTSKTIYQNNKSTEYPHLLASFITY